MSIIFCIVLLFYFCECTAETLDLKCWITTWSISDAFWLDITIFIACITTSRVNSEGGIRTTTPVSAKHQTRSAKATGTAICPHSGFHVMCIGIMPHSHMQWSTWKSQDEARSTQRQVQPCTLCSAFIRSSTSVPYLVNAFLSSTWNYKLHVLFQQMCLFMAHFSHQGTLAVVNLSVISMKYFLSCKHIQMLTFPWSTFIGCYHIKTLTATYLMCVLDIAACFVDSEEMFGVSCTSNVWYYMHFKKTVLIGGPNKMSNIHLFLRNLQSQNRKTW